MKGFTEIGTVAEANPEADFLDGEVCLRQIFEGYRTADIVEKALKAGAFRIEPAEQAA